MQIALGVVVFTDCFCMNDEKILPGDEGYGTKELHLSSHFDKNKEKNIFKNNETNDFNKDILPIILIGDYKVFEYSHLNQMPSYLKNLVCGLLNDCKPELIRKDGVQNFNYEDLLEVLLFLDNQQYYGALKFLCISILQDYSEHFENYRENTIFLRNGGSQCCLYGLVVNLMIHFAELKKSEVLKSFVDAELGFKVTPKDIGSYYQRAVFKLCNNICKNISQYQRDFELCKLEFMLKVLSGLNIDNNFCIPGSTSTVLQWFSNKTEPKYYKKIERLFLKMRKNNVFTYTPEPRY